MAFSYAPGNSSTASLITNLSISDWEQVLSRSTGNRENHDWKSVPVATMSYVDMAVWSSALDCQHQKDQSGPSYIWRCWVQSTRDNPGWLPAGRPSCCLFIRIRVHGKGRRQKRPSLVITQTGHEWGAVAACCQCSSDEEVADAVKSHQSLAIKPAKWPMVTGKEKNLYLHLVYGHVPAATVAFTIRRERRESGEREREKSVESSSEELDPPDRRIKGYIESTTANKEKTHSRNSQKKGGKEWGETVTGRRLYQMELIHYWYSGLYPTWRQ